MDSATIKSTDAAPAHDRLITTLFLAALFHGIVILGVSFGGAGTPDPDALPTLEVLLVDTRLSEARPNEEANYLAQRNNRGAGNTEKAARTLIPSGSALPLDNPGTPEGQALEDRQADHESQQNPQDLAPLTTTGFASRVVRVTNGTLDMTSSSTQTALALRAGPASPLPSEGDDALVLKGRSRDELLITPNTRESDVAVYLDAWKRKVERVGTLNFPLEAQRRHLSGSPVLEVAIRSNGALEDTLIRRSSGHAELDQAALTILRLATPFDPFPAALRSRHRVIRFAYEWQFVQGEWVNSSVQAPLPTSSATP